MGKSEAKLDRPGKTRLCQKTLFDFHSRPNPGTVRKELNKWSDVLFQVEPICRPVFNNLQYDTFFEIVELLEFCDLLRLLFDINVDIDYDNFSKGFLNDLSDTPLGKSHEELYLVCYILIKSVIKLEMEYNRKSKKYFLAYSDKWMEYEEFLSYYTFSEFIRIMIYHWAYKSREYDDMSYRSMIFTPEIFYFSPNDKLKILSKLYTNILDHPTFSEIINNLNETFVRIFD
ncbi:hypothetical protein RF11_08736 [Thelohanellus kitauei]|uniref:Uncharacterized protein n=1 Tax=Thelohanellus kitauei TaxID=669202 RepID=A0A0C2MNY6_THEKT|nr:hypothetical protein RF11_08736 [Thelohanellus kitauei]